MEEVSSIIERTLQNIVWRKEFIPMEDQRTYRYIKCPKCGSIGRIADSTADGQALTMSTCIVCGTPLEEPQKEREEQ